MTTSSRIEHRRDIQLLRGLAVAFVLLYHLRVPGFGHGFLGVDVFFVISGFLMAKLYDKDTVAGFYRRRLDRLFPACAVAVLATLAVGALVLVPVDFEQLGSQAMAAVLGVSNFLFWSQSSYFSNADFNPLLNTWSLGVELQFYLVVPLLFPLVRRSRVLFLLAFVGSLAACVVCQYVTQKLSFFMMPLRAWEFLIGTWVAWNELPPPSGKGRADKVGVVALAMLAACLLVSPIRVLDCGSWLFGHPSLGAFMVTMLTGAVVMRRIPDAVVDCAAGRLLTRIGDLSYSIYLVHFPIVVLMNYEPFGGTRLGLPGPARGAAAVALIVACSLLSYAFVERRYAGLFRSRGVKAALAVLVLVAAPCLVRLNQAMYTPQQNNVFRAFTDRSAYRCGKLFRVLHPASQICPIRRASGTAGRNILLVGNSHADSIKTVFAETAARHGHSVLFCVDNTPLMGGVTADRLFAEAMGKGVDVFVLHYFDSVFGERHRRRNLGEIRTLVRLARGQGKPVYMIGFVPAYAEHVPLAMYEHRPIGLTRAEHERRVARYDAILAELRGMGVRTYDPAPYFLSDDAYLFASDDLEPYYFDRHHLTLTGSRVLIPLFDELLKDVGRR